jgi:hypothetical protein
MPYGTWRGGAIVEGVNMGGIMLGYLAVLVFGVVSLVALGLLLGARIKAARILFASGLLAASFVMILAILSFLAPEYHPGADDLPLLVLGALSLLAGGVGQFVAALRSGRVYTVAFICTSVSFLALTAPMFGVGFAWDWVPEAIRHQFLSPTSFMLAGLFFGMCSLLCAVFLPAAPRPTAMERPDDMNRTGPLSDVDPTSITAMTKENFYRGNPAG